MTTIEETQAEIRNLSAKLESAKAKLAELEAEPKLKYKVGDKLAIIVEVERIDPTSLYNKTYRVSASSLGVPVWAEDTRILGLASDFAPVAKPSDEPLKVGDRVRLLKYFPGSVGTIRVNDKSNLPFYVEVDLNRGCFWLDSRDLERVP